MVVVDNGSASYGSPGRIAQRFATEGWAVATVDGRDHAALAPAPAGSLGRSALRGGGGGALVSAPSPRLQFAATVTDLLDERPDLALVWAEISGQYFRDAVRRHPDRVVNVGIREQLLVNVGAGMALAGLRPVVHTIASFLVERGFEQVKLGFAHQGVGGVLVGSGGSFDVSSGGRTHQSPGDVALLDTVPGMHVHAPGSAAETDDVLRRAVAGTGSHYVRVVEQVNDATFPADGRLHVVRRGRGRDRRGARPGARRGAGGHRRP